jgi:uncharacterized protein YndB with AHSA1/START domain
MNTINKTYVLEFPLELVFSKWIAEDAVISPVERLEIEPHVGGAYRLVMPGGFKMEGAFTEFAENEHMTYSWQWDGGDETTEVDVVFRNHPDGTEVELTHSGFQSSTSYDNHAAGWDAYIDGFSAYLKNNV